MIVASDSDADQRLRDALSDAGSVCVRVDRDGRRWALDHQPLPDTPATSRHATALSCFELHGPAGTRERATLEQWVAHRTEVAGQQAAMMWVAAGPVVFHDMRNDVAALAALASVPPRDDDEAQLHEQAVSYSEQALNSRMDALSILHRILRGDGHPWQRQPCTLRVFGAAHASVCCPPGLLSVLCDWVGQVHDVRATLDGWKLAVDAPADAWQQLTDSDWLLSALAILSAGGRLYDRDAHDGQTIAFSLPGACLSAESD